MAKKKAKYEDSHALFEAAASAQKSRRYDEFKQLLANGLNPDSPFKDENGRTLLFNYHLKESVAKILLDAGANAAYLDANGYTPLHSANPQVAALLLKCGVDIEHRSNNAGVTPLHAHAIRGDAKMVKLLLDHGADVLATYANYTQGVIEAAAFSHQGSGESFGGHEEIYRLVETHVGRGLMKGIFKLRSLQDVR